MASKDKGQQERVYALHDFDAENPDEVSFKAGETIVVVEKDDAYGDGWWQGSNQRGETGLFPFSYTTYDRNAAIGLLSGAKEDFGGNEDASREANGKGVKATMDDIDIALARMQAGRSAVGDDAASERTADLSVGETDENDDDAEDDYEKRAKARAALAVNAAKSNDEQSEADRAEQARLKAQAMRVFQEEEEKHRQLLLKKEEQRKEAAAKGALPDDKQPKSAPIPGVDMSDESDSEGSVGPDIDDAAPTHAPLFGASSTAAAAAAAGGVATAGGLKPQQSRPLSPIPSDDAHARSKELGNKNGALSQQRAEELEESMDSSRVSGSPALGKSVGTAPTSVLGNDTPRSSHATAAQMSPAPSATGSRGGGPGGDPHEWTVEQVIEWGRSKGWDEASIVSKFAEHEISGDVLMEMDANILKEIEITAFGKRFQVANAIKELKRSTTQDGSQSQFSTPVVDSSANNFQPQQQQQTRNFSQPMDRPPSSNADMASSANPFGGLGAPINGLPFNTGQRTTSQQSAQDLAPSPFRAIQPELPENSGDTYPSTFGSVSGDQQGNQDNFRPNSMGSLQGKSSFSPDNSISYSNFNQQHASSPRRRESAGSSLKSPTERTSFFAGLSGQRNRKPAPRMQGGPSPAPPAETEANNKGTLSRLGFNRLKGSQGSDTANAQDLRNKISLPTGSPTFDAMGDTARRHRLSHMGPTAAPPPTNIPGFSGHQRQASVGSGGPGAADWHTPNEPRSPGNVAPEGAVMVRIRPVDYEGWMRKKGERYNSWKPRYMALKGSDLVLLRDPTAPKIKGYVNMKGYKVIADEATNPGKYGFKILHETEKPHYFSSDDALSVRDWMKALMKATIGRDTSLPVISSYNNATISLKEAQRMNPPPRPPSPTSRARAQRAAARANKDQLTAKDASVLMGLQSPQNRAMGLILPESVDRSAAVTKQNIISQLSSSSHDSTIDVGRTTSMKRLAPLKLVRRPKPSYLPDVERDSDHSATTSSPVPPLPPAKAEFDQHSATEGLAELPPPPPPTHSAGHADRVRAILLQRQIRTMPDAEARASTKMVAHDDDLPSPPLPSATPSAPPLPLSKGDGSAAVTTASSVAAYPTVSSVEKERDQEQIKDVDSAPVAGKHAGRISRMFKRPDPLIRPKTAASETSERRSMSVEELMADGAPIPRSADSTKTFDLKFRRRRPRTASDAPTHHQRSRSNTVGMRDREGSFIVFSVRKQDGQQAENEEDNEIQKSSEFGVQSKVVLDKPIQLSPPAISDDQQSSRPSLSELESYGKPTRPRLFSMSNPSIRGNNFDVDKSVKKSSSSIDRARKQNTQTTDENENENEKESTSLSAQIKNVVRRSKLSSSVDGFRARRRRPSVNSSPRANNEIVLVEQQAPASTMPWSGSPYYQSTASASTYSIPRHSSPLVRNSMVVEDRLADLVTSSNSDRDRRRTENEDVGDALSNDVEASARPKTMKFRSWMAWRGNKNKQRDSEVEMERAMAMAESDLRSDSGRGSATGSGDLGTSSSAAGRGTFAAMQTKGFTFRSNASEYFGKLRHQEQVVSMTAHPVNAERKVQVPRTAHAAVGRYGLDVERESDNEGSECMEEVSTSNYHGDHADVPPPPPPSHTPPPPPPVPSPPQHPLKLAKRPSQEQWTSMQTSNLFKRVPAQPMHAQQQSADHDAHFDFSARSTTQDRHEGPQDFGRWSEYSPSHPDNTTSALYDRMSAASPAPASSSRLFVGSFRS